MKKTPLILKIMPVIVVALPFLLAGCEELKSFFGDSSPTPGYDSSYSSPDSQTKNYTAPTNSVKRVNSEEALHSSSEGTTASQSGTAATTVSAPVDTTDKPTAKSTVDGPVVPSMAPTVGQ